MDDINDFYNSEEGFRIVNNFEDELSEEISQNKPQKSQPVSKEIFEWLDVLATAIISVVIIFSILFRVATINGESMTNTLQNNDKVIITNLAYTPKRGDIVVISRNVNNSVEGVTTGQVPIIKRVIAVAGQTVNIDFEKGVVSVDGVELDEPYTRTLTNRQGDVEFPVYVPEGYIFVLGDNRNDSLDSRYTQIGDGGLVDVRYVLGHAVLRVFPFGSAGRLDNK